LFGVVFGVVAFLFTMVKNLHNQAIFSLFAFIVLLWVVIVCIIQGATTALPLEYIQPPFDLTDISPLGTIFFAFTCQMNAMPIYDDLTNPSIKRFRFPFLFPSPIHTHTLHLFYRIVNSVSLLIVTAIFCLFGYFGFVDQGANSNPNILLGFVSGPLVNLLMAIKVILTYPLIVRPMIVSTEKLFPSLVHKFTWNILALVIVTSSVIIGCFFSDISMVTSLVGAITDGLISFFFPALLVLLVNKDEAKDSVHKSNVVLLIQLSLLLMGLSLFGFLCELTKNN
jgi:amino acid permease